MADCLWCGHRIPPDIEDEYCSTLCALRHAQELPLPDQTPEGW